MDKKDLAFKRLFPSISLDGKPFVNMEWSELQAKKKELTAAGKRYLDKLEKRGDEHEANDAEGDALRLLEDMLGAADREIDVRLESGSKGPRTVKIGPSPKKAETGGLRSGEVGLHYEDLFGKGDGLGGFESRDHFFQCVMANAIPESRTMLAGVGAQGGFTIPTEVAREMWSSVIEESACLPYVKTFRMGTGTLNIPCWDSETKSEGGIGGFEGDWLAEDGTATPKSPKLRLVGLTAKKLAVYVDISRECISDSLTLGQQLGPTMVRNLAYSLDAALIDGNGVGRPLGILNSGSRIQVARAAANQISFADVASMYVRLYPGFVKGAMWLASPGAIEQLLKLQDPGNHYLWIPAGDGFKTGVPGNLLGLPVQISEKCKALGTEGDLILCNLGQMAFGLREDFILEKTNAAQWARDLVSLRALVRCDSQPLMDTAITPVSGSTLSWAVTLV